MLLAVGGTYPINYPDLVNNLLSFIMFKLKNIVLLLAFPISVYAWEMPLCTSTDIKEKKESLLIVAEATKLFINSKGRMPSDLAQLKPFLHKIPSSLEKDLIMFSEFDQSISASCIFAEVEDGYKYIDCDVEIYGTKASCGKWMFQTTYEEGVDEN